MPFHQFTVLRIATSMSPESWLHCLKWSRHLMIKMKGLLLWRVLRMHLTSLKQCSNSFSLMYFDWIDAQLRSEKFKFERKLTLFRWLLILTLQLQHCRSWRNSAQSSPIDARRHSNFWNGHNGYKETYFIRCWVLVFRSMHKRESLAEKSEQWWVLHLSACHIGSFFQLNNL